MSLPVRHNFRPAARVPLNDPLIESARLAYSGMIELARKDCPAFCELLLKDEETGSPIELQPFQVEWHDMIDREQYVVIWTFPESGKALPLDTPIATPDGWTPMGELQVGDDVFGRDGKPYPVTWASEIQLGREVYRITFDDGVSILADDDHRWLAWTRGDRAQGKPPRIATTREIRTTLRTGEADSRQRWAIPVPAPVDRPPRELPIDPYVLGVWLGDGTAQSSELSFAEKDREIVDRCRGLEGAGKSYHRLTCEAVTLGPKVPGKPSLRARLRMLGLKNAKHVPGIYLAAGTEQRFELLRGLLDTDGTVQRGKPVAEFATSSPRLRDDFAELARSLGFKARVREKPDRNGRPTYTVALTVRGVRVFWLARKHALMLEGERGSAPNGTTGHRYVVDVVQVDSVPVRCVTVASPDESYIAGRGYVATHNTQQIAIARTLWLLGRDPRKRYAILSATQSQAKKIIRTLQGHIVQNPVIRDVFPNMRRGGLWTDNAIEIVRPHGIKDPSVQAYSPEGGNIQGARLDGLVIDDVLTEINTRTHYQREKTEDWIRASAFPRLADDAAVVFLTNAWHPDDMAHNLVHQGWVSRRHPVLTPEGISMWPARWPLARVERTRTELLGPVEFARQMMCQARDESQSRFRREWIDGCLARGEGLRQFRSLEDLLETCPELAEAWAVTDALARLGGLPEELIIVTGCDIGVSRAKAADESVLFTLAVRPDNSRQILEVQAGRWAGPEIIERIVSVHERFRSTVVVENNAAQDFIVQWTRERAPGLRVRAFTTGRNKLSPEFGVESLAAELAGSMWVIPCERGTRKTDPQIGAWISDMLAYDPRSHTGDRLMASWIAREAARAYATRRDRRRARSRPVVGAKIGEGGTP